MDTLEDRFKSLNQRYLNQAIANKNPVISDSMFEYRDFASARSIKYLTPLCPFKDLIVKLGSHKPP